MPSHRHHDHGNLYVRLNVKFPEEISEEQRALLEKALPPRPTLPQLPKKLEIEEVTLQEPTERQKMQNDPDAMDEDDEDGPRGGVQCAQREFHNDQRSNESNTFLDAGYIRSLTLSCSLSPLFPRLNIQSNRRTTACPYDHMSSSTSRFSHDPRLCAEKARKRIEILFFIPNLRLCNSHNHHRALRTWHFMFASISHQHPQRGPECEHG